MLESKDQKNIVVRDLILKEQNNIQFTGIQNTLNQKYEETRFLERYEGSLLNPVYYPNIFFETLKDYYFHIKRWFDRRKNYEQKLEHNGGDIKLNFLDAIPSNL